MYILAAFIHNIIQRSREGLKKVRKKILNLFQLFGPLEHHKFMEIPALNSFYAS